MNRLTTAIPAAVASLLMTVLCVAPPLAAAVEITALVDGEEPLQSTEDIRLSRFADLVEEPSVSIGMTLEPGDLLLSVSGRVELELTCGEETVLQFAGAFRAVINPAIEADCAVNFLAGTLDVLTDVPTEVTAGGIVLGNEGSRYEVTLVSGLGGGEEDVLVFDGKVNLRGRDLRATVDSGFRWRRSARVASRSRRPRVEAIDEATYDRAAYRLARLDIAKAVISGENLANRSASVAELRTLHYQVLKQPADKGMRLALAKRQIDYKSDRQAALHLKKADVTTDAQLRAVAIDPSRVSRYLTVRPSPTLTPTPTPSPEPNRVQLDRPVRVVVLDPYAMITAGNYDQAIELLAERSRSEPTARIWCGLARAWSGKEGPQSRRAIAYAQRASERRRAGDALSGEEFELCRRLAATQPR